MTLLLDEPTDNVDWSPTLTRCPRESLKISLQRGLRSKIHN